MSTFDPTSVPDPEPEELKSNAMIRIDLLISIPDLEKPDALGAAVALSPLMESFGDRGIVVHEVNIQKEDA